MKNRWFVVDDREKILPNFFKGIVTPSTRRKNIHFAVTGSGMVLAWANFLSAPANSHTLAGRARQISIIVNEDQKVCDLTKIELQKYEKSLPDDLFNGVTKSPAGLSYAATEWLLSPDRKRYFLSST